jgi:hypothetical protein
LTYLGRSPVDAKSYDAHLSPVEGAEKMSRFAISNQTTDVPDDALLDDTEKPMLKCCFVHHM